VGPSGVGKTTLLNALEPGLGQRVREINQATGKGRHTTSALEMFPLTCGGYLVDTPGMREYGLWQVDPRALASLYPEMRPFLGQCRFGVSCRHDKEPDFAIKTAVEEGTIHPRRYASFLRLASESREGKPG
jgi:ribosome biogenesis GTPase